MLISPDVLQRRIEWHVEKRWCAKHHEDFLPLITGLAERLNETVSAAKCARTDLPITHR